MCAGVVSVMYTLGRRAVWAMGERVGYGKIEFSFRGAAAVAIDHEVCRYRSRFLQVTVQQETSRSGEV